MRKGTVVEFILYVVGKINYPVNIGYGLSKIGRVGKMELN